MNRLRSLLLGLTVLLLAVSAGALLVRPSVESAERPAAALVTPTATPASDSVAALQTSRVIRGNLFAPDRAPAR